MNDEIGCRFGAVDRSFFPALGQVGIMIRMRVTTLDQLSSSISHSREEVRLDFRHRAVPERIYSYRHPTQYLITTVSTDTL